MRCINRHRPAPRRETVALRYKNFVADAPHQRETTGIRYLQHLSDIFVIQLDTRTCQMTAQPFKSP
jgi:hypothetical protein